MNDVQLAADEHDGDRPGARVVDGFLPDLHERALIFLLSLGRLADGARNAGRVDAHDACHAPQALNQARVA